MLLKITDCAQLDARQLMDIYAESNRENTAFFYPEEGDPAVALRKVEAGFLDFLQNDFLRQEGNACWVLVEDGVWVSALRTYAIEAGLHYLEALETRPDRRKQGYGAALLSRVVETMKIGGPFRLCDCVEKKNIASLKTHEKCGFRIVSEQGYDYLSREADERDFGLEYRYLGE